MLHYIVNYSSHNLCRKVRKFESVNNKVDYILSVLHRLNYDVSILSTLEGEFGAGFIPSDRGTTIYGDNIKYIATCGSSNLLYRIATVLLTYIQILFYLFFVVKKGDVVLLYHSYRYIYPLYFYRFFSKRKVILELEELYSITWGKYKNKSFEERYVRNVPDAYILVNNVIGKRCKLVKNSIVCYGNYSFKNASFIKSDGLIRIVYGGLIKNDSDAFKVVDITKHLSNQYRVHIAGYGDNKDIDLLKSKIDAVNDEVGYKIIQYEGNLAKNDYYELLKKCSFGFCIKSMELSENSDYYYPSKILIYLGNGVVPICSKMNSVIKSDFSDNILFVNSTDSVEIAKEIMSASVDKFLNISLDRYDADFCEKLNYLLANI